MSIHTYPSSPIFDDYDESKDFVQILAQAGNYAQSREFTQMGTIFRDYMERMGAAMFSSGQIISGCGLMIDLTAGTATVLPGSIFIDGLVRKIRTPQVLSIEGVGVEKIGVRIEESLVTVNEDESLRNPAVGTEGYNTEGGVRVRQRVIVSVNDPSSVVIYTLQDGDLVSDVVEVEDDTDTRIYDQLAQRTYDVSGNFKVEGLMIFDKDNSKLPTTDPSYGKSQVYIGAGRAYILGYYVRHNSMTVVDCEIPQTTRICNNEPKVFHNITEKYYFNYNPLHEVRQVTTILRRTFDIIRGSTQGGRDFVVNGLSKIETVTQGTKTYVEGVDFSQVGNQINWDLLGEEPATGTTYKVTCRYYYTNEEGTDYTIGGEGDSKYILFKSSTPNVPIENSEMLLDYSYYLSRIDLYMMNPQGLVEVIKGVPDIAEQCIVPQNSNKSLLVLGYVLNYANSTRKKITNLYSIRLTQSDIYSLKRRIEDLEYDIAVSDLDKEAKEGEDATDLKGVYTDGFLGYSKCDLYHADWDACIDIDQQELTVPYDISMRDMRIGASSEANVVGQVVSAPFSEVVAISQPLATTPMLVNPYAVYKDLCVMSIDPARDAWTSVEHILVEDIDTSYTTAKTTKKKKAGTFTTNTVVSDETRSTETKITFMRGRWIKIHAINFEPEEWPIRLSFIDDDISSSAQFSPSGTITDDFGYTFSFSPRGSKQTLTGTRIKLCDETFAEVGNAYLKADSNGVIETYIKLPEGKYPCGVASISLTGRYTSTKTNYTAEGTLITETQTVRIAQEIKKVKYKKKTSNPEPEVYDPLAQTFSFDTNTILTGFDLFFAAKDPVRGVVIQVRDVVNGYPGTTVYDEVSIENADIRVSASSLNPTHVLLNQTVYCEKNKQYALVILTDSSATKHWIAEMGETDITSGEMVQVNPYTEGVLFSSSNGLAWTAHQSADLTFVAYKAQYNPEGGSVVFENLNLTQASAIMAAAYVEDQDNSGITWYYKTDTDEDWILWDNFAMEEFTRKITTVDIKAHINVTNNLSPVIARDACTLVWMLNHRTGTYVSRRIEMGETFTNLKVSCQLALADGCSAKVYYQLEDVSDTWVLLTDADLVSCVKENDEFDKYTWEKDLGSGAKWYRVKVVLESRSEFIKPRARKLMSILRY